MMQSRMPATSIVAIAPLILLALVASVNAQPRPLVEAYAGEPFGVGRITFSLPPASADRVEPNQVEITGDAGRVFYPAVSSSAPARELLGGLLGSRPLLGALAREVPGSLSVYFLFEGRSPFRVTVRTPAPHHVLVTPRPTLRGDERLLRDWWRKYSLAANEQALQGDYPPIVETYLTNMLPRRLGLDRAARRVEPRSETRLQDTLDLFLGVEDLRRDVMIETLRSAHPVEEATLPVPDDIAWMDSPPREIPDDVEIEPIAMRIPEECFYLRFGNIANFIWLHHLTEEHGGALGRLISLRGHDVQATQRIEGRLGVRYSLLLDLVGERVVDDLAVFGRDTYLREGAAIAVLIKAKNAFLVSTALNSERNQALVREKERGAASETVEIAGRTVSFISTPDNRLRSFFVRDGDYCLLSTSRALVERYFEAADGERALGASADFRYARSQLPNSREDTIFAYFSPAFFRGLVSPHYQIELHRRLRATTDIELVELARLAARGEGRPHGTIDELIQGGFLPPDFLSRPDGSRVVIEGDRVLDSLRGARGNFLPIPDTPVTAVTSSEARRFSQAAATWSLRWRQMDPVAVGVQRSPRDENDVERITIDGFVSTLLEEKYAPYLAMLGPATKQTLAPVEGNLLSAELSARAGQSSAAPQLVFLGVQDQPRLGMQGWPGVIRSIAFLRTIPGYLGAAPKAGVVDMLPLGLSPPPDRNGFSQLPLGVWRREWDNYSVLSFDPQLLARVTPQLRVTEDSAPAQARLHVADLTQARHTSWINEFFYDRARRTTAGNIALLHALTRQLGVPPSEALAEANRLLDVQLTCSLGGEYRLTAARDGAQQWTTTAAAPASEYRPPLVAWLRGADARLTKEGDQLTLHAEIAMQRKESTPAFQLPALPFFGGKKEASPEAPPESKPKPATPPAPTGRRDF
ncbi:MAG: hypothetical protein KY475_05605 [Planctomycetes bacterium]|nr:hypothetical protein [Planctomycetota bacterium]